MANQISYASNFTTTNRKGMVMKKYVHLSLCFNFFSSLLLCLVSNAIFAQAVAQDSEATNDAQVVTMTPAAQTLLVPRPPRPPIGVLPTQAIITMDSFLPLDQTFINNCQVSPIANCVNGYCGEGCSFSARLIQQPVNGPYRFQIAASIRPDFYNTFTFNATGGTSYIFGIATVTIEVLRLIPPPRP